MLEYLLFVDTITSFSLGLFGPIYAIFVEDIGGDILSASSVWAAYTIVIGVMIIIFGKLEDRIKREGRVMTLGYSLISLSILGYYFVSNPLELLIVQIVLGIGVAIVTPSFDTLYCRYLERKKVGFEWGLWEGLGEIFTGLSAIAGGIIAAFFGFKLLFIIMFLVSLAAVLVSIKEFSLK